MHRASGLKFSSLAEALTAAFKNFKYSDYPDFLMRKELDEDLKAKIPLFTDALPYWRILQKYVECQLVELAQLELYLDSD